MPSGLRRLTAQTRQWLKDHSTTWAEMKQTSRRLARERMVDAATEAATQVTTASSQASYEGRTSDAQDKR